MTRNLLHAGALSCALLTSTVLSIPAQANDLVPPKVFTRTPGGVNISDGAYTESNTDLQIGTLSLERFHLGVPRLLNSPRSDPNDPFFGKHVSHNFDIYVARNLSQASNGFPQMYKPIVHMGLVASGLYHQDRQPANLPVRTGSTESEKGVLAMVNGNYVYTDEGGAVYQFDQNIPAAGVTGGQRVTSITYPDGRVLTFSYNGAKQLKVVRDNQGFAIVFDYAVNGNVSAACGFNAAVASVSASSTCSGASLKTTYSYTGDLLTAVTDVTGGTTSYVYSQNQLCITPPGLATCRILNTYNQYEQVTQQTLADGATWTLLLGPPVSRDPENYPEVESRTRVTDPAGHYSDYVFTGSTLNQITDANSNITTYHFEGISDYNELNPLPNQGSMLKEVVAPEGNRYVADRQGPWYTISSETWHAKPNSSTSNASILYGYGDCAVLSRLLCTRPIWKRDPKNNQTDFTYNDAGQLLTETGPAVGGIRPQTRHEYTLRHAWINNGAGGYVQAGAPISVRVATSVCRTSAATGNPAAPCATPGDEVRTTYDYGPDTGPNNLLPRGQVVTADGQSLRTCTGYDQNGRRISETGTGAQLTQCQ